MAGGEVPEVVLKSVDEPRRAFLKKLILGSAFVVPSIASFSMAGLSVGEAAVCASNQLGFNVGANLVGYDFSQQNLSGQDFAGDNLATANFAYSTLTGCNFSCANLEGANLTGANLTGANLTGANLAAANLAGANLSGADLNGANLTAADLTGVTWSNTTCPDGTNSSHDPGGTCLLHLL